MFFHFIWDVVLSIDFHIFQDGENHQPGMFPYFSDDEVAVDAHGQMVRPPEDLVPWVIKPISPSWVVDIYIYIPEKPKTTKFSGHHRKKP